MTTVEIDNPAIEAFLYKQAKVNNVHVNDYLSSVVMYQMEKESMIEDMKVLENEIKQVNDGTIKLKPAHLLLNKL